MISGLSPKIFGKVFSTFITIICLALLRINKTKQKWRLKIAKALLERSHKKGLSWPGDWTRRYAMFLLPFITTMREGVEAVVFIGGILAGLAVGYLLYRGENAMSIQIFLIASTCVLYLIAAGMFSKSIWSLQYHVFAEKVGSDVADVGNGPGSYNILQSLFHVNCCNPETDNGWDVFNAILGWENSATYGSVISYSVYWIFIMGAVSWMLYEERSGKTSLMWNLLSKVPGLKWFANRKLEALNERPDEVVQQVRTGVFEEMTENIELTTK